MNFESATCIGCKSHNSRAYDQHEFVLREDLLASELDFV